MPSLRSALVVFIWATSLNIPEKCFGLPSIQGQDKISGVTTEVPSWHPRRNRRARQRTEQEAYGDLQRPDFHTSSEAESVTTPAPSAKPPRFRGRARSSRRSPSSPPEPTSPSTVDILDNNNNKHDDEIHGLSKELQPKAQGLKEANPDVLESKEREKETKTAKQERESLTDTTIKSIQSGVSKTSTPAIKEEKTRTKKTSQSRGTSPEDDNISTTDRLTTPLSDTLVPSATSTPSSHVGRLSQISRPASAESANSVPTSKSTTSAAEKETAPAKPEAVKKDRLSVDSALDRMKKQIQEVERRNETKVVGGIQRRSKRASAVRSSRPAETKAEVESEVSTTERVTTRAEPNQVSAGQEAEEMVEGSYDPGASQSTEEGNQTESVENGAASSPLAQEQEANLLKWEKYERSYNRALCAPEGDGRRCPLNVLQTVSSKDVAMKPFPHLVIYDALPEEIYSKLEASFPSDRYLARISKGRDQALRNNFRVDIPAMKSLKNDESKRMLDPFIVDFVAFHTSQAFYKEVLRVLGPAIDEVRPDASKTKPLKNFNVAIRGNETNSTNLRMDCQIGMNTPVIKESTPVRGLHYDESREIFAGLLYLRHPTDNITTGGELQVWDCESGERQCADMLVPESEKAARGLSTRHHHDQFDPKELRLVATVPYRRNTLVFFVNSKTSVHGVSPRSQGPFSRRLINFIGNKN